MDSTLIQAVATVVLVFVTGYYAYTNHKLMKNQEKLMKRSRKEDEVRSIITPIIQHCSREIEIINENRILTLSIFKGFNNDFSKNNIKNMVYEDFISNYEPLKQMINTHDNLIDKVKEQDALISKKFDEEKYQLRIGDMIREFNRESTLKISETNLYPFSETLLIYIMEEIDEDKLVLGEPIHSFWKKYKKELLSLRETDFKINIEELNELRPQLIKINNDIIVYLKKICNEYTKEFDISLNAEINSLFS